MDIDNLSPQALAQACAHAMWEHDHATQHLNMKLLSVDAGKVSINMSVQKFMLNGHGTCHGGYLFTLADSCFAFACNTYNQRTVAQHCSITYLAPVFEHDELTASAHEVSRADRSGIYDVVIRNQRNEHVVEFRGHSRTIKGLLLSAN